MLDSEACHACMSKLINTEAVLGHSKRMQHGANVHPVQPANLGSITPRYTGASDCCAAGVRHSSLPSHSRTFSLTQIPPCKKESTQIMLRVILAIAGLAIFSLAISFSRHAALMPDSTSQLPVIGLALTANHATASVRWPDGTFKDLGRVESSTEYLQLMQRLSLPTSMHLR